MEIPHIFTGKPVQVTITEVFTPKRVALSGTGVLATATSMQILERKTLVTKDGFQALAKDFYRIPSVHMVQDTFKQKLERGVEELKQHMGDLHAQEVQQQKQAKKKKRKMTVVLPVVDLLGEADSWPEPPSELADWPTPPPTEDVTEEPMKQPTLAERAAQLKPEQIEALIKELL